MRSLCILALTLTITAAWPWHKAAEQCTPEVCQIANNCRCSTTSSPLTEGTAPQLITLTFDDAALSNLFDTYWQPMLINRLNPDGKQVGATFYVPHEYSDYEVVQKLYLAGFDIAVNSISKNVLQDYWKNASLQTLKDEFGGQRTIISTFANIPIDDIVGARTPQLHLQGDNSITAYTESGVLYDNTWPTLSTAMLFPYTLDFATTQQCTADQNCPTESHPGFWIAPITNIRGAGNIECNVLINCNVEGTAPEIAAWLLAEVDRIREGNRAPLNLIVGVSWFQITENSFEGFNLFLDGLAERSDVFLVSQRQVLDWMRNPVPVENFQTATYDRQATCDAINCELYNIDHNVRYMKSCVPCPKAYPWVGNPLGEEQVTTPPPDTTTPPPTTPPPTTPPPTTTPAP